MKSLQDIVQSLQGYDPQAVDTARGGHGFRWQGLDRSLSGGGVPEDHDRGDFAARLGYCRATRVN